MKRNRLTKAERKAVQEKEMRAFLKRMGYSGSGPKESVHEIPRYRTDNYKMTSNQVPGNGARKDQNTYSGEQLLGISQMHKSNAVPIRKDNKQAAVETSQMRRS